MAANSRRAWNDSRLCQNGSAIIGAGLVLLIAATWSPIVPAVTGMSLVALGAIAATRTSFRASPALGQVILLSAVVYSGLYAIFIGATIHAAAQSVTGIGLLTAIDLAVSIWPISAALAIVGVSLRNAVEAE